MIDIIHDEIYCVTIEGIHIRAVVGVYPTLDACREAIERMAAEQPDDYHDFLVQKGRMSSSE